MSVNIGENSYFSASMHNENSDLKKIIKDNVKIALKFHYGNVTYLQFLDEYSLSNEKQRQITRKCTAFPNALWLVAKVVFHFARIFFLQLPLALLRDSHLKYHIFYFIREMQELLGTLTCLFHDSYGLYHIQESRIQRSCYDKFFIQKPTNDRGFFTSNIVKNIQDNESKNTNVEESSSKIEEESKSKIEENSEINQPIKQAESSSSSNIVLDQIIRNDPLIKLVESYCAEQNLIEAAEKIHRIIPKMTTLDLRNLGFELLAEEYFKRGNITNALKIYKEIFDEKKESLLVNWAEWCIWNFWLPSAYSVIKVMTFDTKRKEALLTKLVDKIMFHAKYVEDFSWAQDSLKKGELEMVFLMKEVSSDVDYNAKEKFLSELMAGHQKYSRKADVIKVIEFVISNEINQLQSKVKNWVDLKEKMADFVRKLAHQRYSKIEKEAISFDDQVINVIKKDLPNNEESLLVALAL